MGKRDRFVYLFFGGDFETDMVKMAADRVAHKRCEHGKPCEEQMTRTSQGKWWAAVEAATGFC